MQQKGKQTAIATKIKKLALAGQPDQAFSLVQTLSPEKKNAVLGSIALGYAKAGQLDRALSIAISIPQADSRKSADRTLVDMAEALSNVGKNQQALALLAHITNAKMRYQELYEIAFRILTDGNLDQALALVQPVPLND